MLGRVLGSDGEKEHSAERGRDASALLGSIDLSDIAGDEFIPSVSDLSSL